MTANLIKEAVKSAGGAGGVCLLTYQQNIKNHHTKTY